METVTYTDRFEYTHDQQGRTFPLLPLRISLQYPPSAVRDVDGYLDTLAYRSLFDGQIARLLGLDLFAGRVFEYRSTMGISIEARLHQVWLSHPNLGAFQLEVGFSIVPITRNLLSRDFLNRIQIGFREHLLTFFVTPTP